MSSRKRPKAQALSQLLMALAVNAVDDDPDSTTLSDVQQRLANTIAQVVKRGNDQPIVQALEG